MNAYELATEIRSYYLSIRDEYDGFGFLDDIANMLRQQADRIKELEAWQKHDLELAEATGFEVAYRLQADRIAELEKEIVDLLEELKASYDGQ